MRHHRALLVSLSLLPLAACGGGGTGSPTNGTSTCFYSPQGQLVSLTAAEIANVNASVAANGVSINGIILGGRTIIRMIITRPPPGTLMPNEAMIGIDYDQAIVYPHAVHAKNVCSGFESMLTKTPGIRGVVSTKITKAVGSAGFDTVEFHQPSTFGIWVQIGEMLPSTFWAIAAGNEVTFLYLTD